ncbi:MAG: hypothetical protein FWC36_00520 [Spirochaetes bacterium]|nr:hypothetical protein [Spirochaetota bacterium]
MKKFILCILVLVVLMLGVAGCADPLTKIEYRVPARPASEWERTKTNEQIEQHLSTTTNAFMQGNNTAIAISANQQGLGGQARVVYKSRRHADLVREKIASELPNRAVTVRKDLHFNPTNNFTNATAPGTNVLTPVEVTVENISPTAKTIIEVRNATSQNGLFMKTATEIEQRER